MEWIKILLPIIGVLIGWLLSERGKIFADQRHDKRKLRKLLFFLLELRYCFAKELSSELNLDKFLLIFKGRLAIKIGLNENDPKFIQELNMVKPFLKKHMMINGENEKFQYLAKNIDSIIIELAEIYPFIAYELSGTHNIKEKLDKANDYFDEVQNLTNETQFDFKKWINPKLTQNLLDSLDKSINKIAGRIGFSTVTESLDKISSMTFEDDVIEIDNLIDELFKLYNANDDERNL